MADLGSAAKCDMDGAPVLPRCPKEPFLRKPDGSNGSRPDAIILHKSEGGSKNTIYIILGSMISAVVGGLVSYFGHFTTSH